MLDEYLSPEECLRRQKSWAESLEKLRASQYLQGWPKHEWIPTGNLLTQDHYEPTPAYGKPIWRGETEPISLLVTNDFGMGDTIHFFRYIKEVQARVSRVILQCDEDFFSLFWRLVECDDKTVRRKSDVPMEQIDKVIHIMALPEALGIKEISGKPYLEPNSHTPPYPGIDILDTLRFTKIGVCWQGNPFNPKDHFRSIPVDMITKIWFREGIWTRMFSLNKTEVAPLGFMDMRPCMRDWNDTAYLLKKLDLVISVDTAVAHLAGALGVPVWLLLPKKCDWRWPVEDGNTPWYDSMKVFHVKTTWMDLLREVLDMLKKHELLVSQ